MKKLWVEQYRPTTLDGYVFRDNNQKKQIQAWVTDKTIPHLLFSGSAGVGKTTLAKILINELDIEEYDIKEINASRDNGVDYIRDTITGFVQTMPFGEFKIVLLDEADYLSANAQAVLRGLMEKYAHTARFILTCNYPYKIIGPLHSRCQGFHIDKVDQTEFTARAAEILITEDVNFDLETLDTYVKGSYPDLRKCLNSCQMNSTTGELIMPHIDDVAGGSEDYKIAVVELFKTKQYKKARELLCASVRPEEMESIFKWTYNNLDLWGDTDEQQDEAIKIIRNSLVNHSFCADSEINLSACIIELCQIREG